MHGRGRFSAAMVGLGIFLFALVYLFFCNDTATTEIYTLSLHDALPICSSLKIQVNGFMGDTIFHPTAPSSLRSEEHTSELQSRENLVCRLPHEKKNLKKKNKYTYITINEKKKKIKKKKKN